MDGSTSRSLTIATPSETNLTSTVLDEDQRILLLTAANTGSGTSTSALAFASQLALMSGGPVLLVDSSPSSNNLSQQLALHKLRGFSDLMFDQDTPPLMQDCIVRLSDQPFDLLPAGTYKRGKERLNPDLLRVLLKHMSEHYRFVVIDGEAVYASADSLIIGTLVDGVILVVCAEDTRWEVAQATAQRLTQAGARLIGSVFNRRKYYMPKWLYNNL
ncbi:CpsD/CapB family tyrosine-protein kinase [Pseudomonas donghuensis]|uniref:CpsD/CapB family tyrosine-protein kinase n=1 Tax=Pseudomonas donghuensis TaxID=1163398 RepID=A0AAP0X5M9_9PSED|nr:CpsD/CapB family tyrosine-protein kinase [Pseudomonas donghuensis]MDF9893766.1 Mrp family chromosome partitioning ATPase [Pseudomonas vranovensis]KDN97096.1 CpsD/CapB family tyrosine-protein kinase [Pseudomonas donghuensis]MBF4210390.1 cobalamin biosynthesis protein CobQ [Pseudomonas donghuensis]MCP6692516.1 CpsD/CapB family tyrosine-protein kinase [Pseudomonas donghuensis]PJY94508.1 cobalamin biosynthesis protein CobQ [Pseudomonas donghuensis]